jgi:hypothetical protein
LFFVVLSKVFLCVNCHNRLVIFKLILVSLCFLRFYDGVFLVLVIISFK